MAADCYFGRYDFDDYNAIQVWMAMMVRVRECYWIN